MPVHPHRSLSSSGSYFSPPPPPTPRHGSGWEWWMVGLVSSFILSAPLLVCSVQFSSAPFCFVSLCFVLSCFVTFCYAIAPSSSLSQPSVRSAVELCVVWLCICSLVACLSSRFRSGVYFACLLAWLRGGRPSCLDRGLGEIANSDWNWKGESSLSYWMIYLPQQQQEQEQ